MVFGKYWLSQCFDAKGESVPLGLSGLDEGKQVATVWGKAWMGCGFLTQNVALSSYEWKPPGCRVQGCSQK